VSLDDDIIELMQKVTTAADYLKDAVDSIAQQRQVPTSPQPLQLVCRKVVGGTGTGVARQDLKQLGDDLATTFDYLMTKTEAIARKGGDTSLPPPLPANLVCRL
jgi:hypothetical protein